MKYFIFQLTKPQRIHHQSKESLGLLRPHPPSSVSSKPDKEEEGSLNNPLLEL